MLLIIDEFKSHATILFFELIIVNNIILFWLSAHSIYFSQLLNVDVFQSYKHYHTETINHAVRMKNKKFEKLKILIVYQTFRIQIFKLSIIRHVFKATNIVPFNFNMIFDIIRQKIIKNTQQFRIFNLSSQLMKHIFKNSEFIRKFKTKIDRAVGIWLHIALTDCIWIRKIFNN